MNTIQTLDHNNTSTFPRKWSDISYEGTYAKSNENRQAVLGYFLYKNGINLENLPEILFEPFSFFPRNEERSNYQIKRVYLKDVIGTSRQDYSEDNQLLYSFMKLKRIEYYIINERVTPNKYFKMLKSSNQENLVKLSQCENNKYYVDGNGNHRIITYKIMMLAEISKIYGNSYLQNCGFSLSENNKIAKKYWLNAIVYE